LIQGGVGVSTVVKGVCAGVEELRIFWRTSIGGVSLASPGGIASSATKGMAFVNGGLKVITGITTGSEIRHTSHASSVSREALADLISSVRLNATVDVSGCACLDQVQVFTGTTGQVLTTLSASPEVGAANTTKLYAVPNGGINLLAGVATGSSI
jgi:hypothetical protein